MPDHRFIIVDDHPLFRGALAQSLMAAFPGADILEAGSLDELVARLETVDEVDLILLDLTMPGVQGPSGLLFLRQHRPAIPVVIVSASAEPVMMRRCLDFGASGYVPKSEPPERIREAVRAVLAGQVWSPPEVDLSTSSDDDLDAMPARLATLTPQQVRVLMMLGEGLLNKQIAFKLGVSEATIKAHVSAVLQKLGVDSRTQAVIAINRMAATDRPKSAQ